MADGKPPARNSYHSFAAKPLRNEVNMERLAKIYRENENFRLILKLFFIPAGSPRQDEILYITGRFYTNRNPILAEKFHLNGKPYTGSKYQRRR